MTTERLAPRERHGMADGVLAGKLIAALILDSHPELDLVRLMPDSASWWCTALVKIAAAKPSERALLWERLIWTIPPAPLRHPSYKPRSQEELDKMRRYNANIQVQIWVNDPDALERSLVKEFAKRDVGGIR